MRNRFFALALSFALVGPALAATPIERVKISDGELTCAQLHQELGEMDKVIAEAKEAEAAGQNTATAGQVGGVAAEVASRTGLFGAIGGLAGHIFGSVASKAAANVAEQSGGQAAQESAERGRQALARKEHLSTLFINRGCKPSDPNFEPAAGAQAPVKLAVAQPAAKPTLDQIMAQASAQPAAVEVSLETNRTGVSAAPRAFVPGFRVAFVVKTGASARAGSALANLGQHSASPFGTRTITQGRNVSVEMMLANVDQPLMQAIADRLYADFVARLKAAGKEVIDIETVKATPGFEKLKPVQEKPYAVSPWTAGDPRSYIVVSGGPVPLWFMHIDSYLGNAGPFDQDNTKAIHEVAARLDAVAYIPTLQIDIAEIESSGNSLFRSNAEADLKPKMGITERSQLQFVNGKDVKIFYTGEMGFARASKAFYLDGEVGEVKSVSSYNDAAFVNIVTAATGVQGTQRIAEKRELRADPVKFADGALRAGATFNERALAVLKTE